MFSKASSMRPARGSAATSRAAVSVTGKSPPLEATISPSSSKVCTIESASKDNCRPGSRLLRPLLRRGSGPERVPDTRSVARCSKNRSVVSASSPRVARNAENPTTALTSNASSPNRRARRDRKVTRRPRDARRSRYRARCARVGRRRRPRACGGDSRCARRATSSWSRSRSPRSTRTAGCAT